MANNFSDLDQLFLEYVNRARLDPGREVARLLADPNVSDYAFAPGAPFDTFFEMLEDLQQAGLNRGLAPGSVSGDPLQALAPNALLRDAAEGHSQWMLDANIFSHHDGNGADAAESIQLRIEASGYASGGFGFGENLSWTGTTGVIDMEAAVVNHAAGLFNSDGHRANILADFFRETGVAQLEGQFTHTDGTTYNTSMLTQKFAVSGTNVFLTGVVYTDSDGDGFYSLGEGESGVSIATTSASTVSATHGGYALGIAPASDVAVTLTWGSVDIGATVDLSGDNVKLDLVAGSDDSLRLLSSGDLILGAGASEAGLLGAANLSLQANDDGNLLIGNFGDNTLTGGAGNDTLEGGAGNDTLDGGGGVNTAVFSGDMADYDITTDDATGITTVTDMRAGTVLNPNDGVNTLSNINYIQFADQLHTLAAPDENGGGSDMSAFTLSGFGFSFDDDSNQVTAITGPATLALTFNKQNPVISYTQITLFDEHGAPDYGMLPDVEIGGDEPTHILLNNALLNTEEAHPAIGRLDWSEGGEPRATDIFSIYISDEEQYFFVLGGDPIPEDPTPAQLNAIIFEAVANNGGDIPLPLPPAGSDFPPDTAIALSDVDSWEQADTSSLQTITLSGFSVLDPGPGQPPSSAGLQPSEFALTFAGPDASLTHQVSGIDPDSDAPIFRLSFDQLPVGLMLNGAPIPMPEPDVFEFLAGRIVSDEQIYDVLILDDFANDRIHFIQLGGEPLPDGTSVAAVDALLAEPTFFGEIPPGEPTSAGTPISLAGIPGAVVIEVEPVAPEVAALAEASNLAELETALAAFAATQEGLDIPAERLSQLAGDLMLYRNTEFTLDWNGTVIAVEDDAADDFAVDDTVSGRYRFNLPLAEYGDDQLGDALDPKAIFQYEQFGLAGSGFSVGIPDLRLNSPSLRMQTFEFNADDVDGSTLLADLFGTDASLLVDGQTYTELMIWLSSAVGIQDDVTGDFAITGTEVTLNLILPGVVGLEAFIDQLDQIPLTYVDVTYTFDSEEVGQAFIRTDTIASSSVVPLPDSPELLVDILNAFMEARDAFDAVLAEANDHALTAASLNTLRESASTLFELLGGASDIDNSFFGAPYLAGKQLPEAVAARLQLFHDLDPNQKVSFLAAFNAQERAYDSVTDILRAPEFLALAGLDPDGPGLPEPSGDPAIMQFDGYWISEDEDDNVTDFEAVTLTFALPQDDAIYSYINLPDPDGPPVDISGPVPYAVLVDGVVPFNQPYFEFQRVTVDGIDYDLMILFDPQSDETENLIFQLDGATPLPFTSLADVQVFANKIDESNAGPIPQGSPFAPGTDFTFLNSPYVTADTSPQIIEGGDFWRGAHGAEYGRGADTAGGLSIVNGADLTLTADGLAGPFMSVGRDGGYGVVTVAGPDSSLDLVAGGGTADPNWGASVSIGRDGGTGGMRILDGGSFSMTDPVGTWGGSAPDFDGREYLWVGRGPDGYGYVDVIGGSFLHAGTGTIAAYGRQAGEGYLYVADGGTYRQHTTSDNDFTFFAIGSQGGFGEAVIDHGNVTIQAGDMADGTVDIGANGSGGHDTPGGILRIFGTQGDEDEFPVHGLMITGGANSPFVEAVLGRNGGGMVEMHGGYFGVLNRGDPDFGGGGDAEMTVGRDGGCAEINANDSAEVFVSGTDTGRMFIGAGNGSRGEVFLDDAEIRVYSWNGEAGLEVGTWNGGTGLLRMVNGSDVDIWGGAIGGYMNIGHGDGSFGELEMVDSTATIRSTNDAWAYLGVATNGGAADMSMIDSNLTVMAEGDGDPSVDIGRNENATAMVEITGTHDMGGNTQHGLIAMGGANSGFAGIDIGKYGGSGTVIVNAAYFGALNNGSHFDPETGDLVPPVGTGGMAGIRVGHDGGSGEFQAMNGAEIFAIGGSDQGHFIVGDGADSYGDAHFDASALVLSAQSGFAFMGVGRRGGEGHLRFSDGSEVIFDALDHVSVAADVGARGGEGTVLLESGSSINGGGLGSFYVGSEYPDNPGTGGADGTLTVTGDGSRITGFRELLIGNNVPEIGTATGVVNVLDGAFIRLGHPDIDTSSFLYVGRYGGAQGTLNITDSVVSLQGANGSDGAGDPWQPYTAIGYFGGTGIVNITGTAPGQEDDVGFVQIGGGESRFATLDIGRGADANGSVNVAGGFFGTENRGETYSSEPPFDPVDLPGDGGRALIRVGVDGATGALMASDNALVFIESGDQSGTSIDDPNVGGSVLIVGGEVAAAGGTGGTGMVALDGSRLEITSSGGIAGMRIGNGETGNGTVSLLNGTVAAIEAGTVAFVGVGREGGSGELSLDGAGTSATVTGAEAVSMIVGGDPGSSGTVAVTDGAELLVEPGTTGALLEIGKDGGHGTVSLAGAGSALAFAATGGGSEIRIATEGAGSFGLLHIDDGASVTTGTVSVGAADTKGVLVFADGGSLTADTVTVNAEGVLGGTGTVTGDVVVNGGAVGAGDTWTVGGGPTDGGWGIGTLTVEGSFTQTGGEIYFDFGETGNDLLDVTGALSFTGTEFTLQYNGDLPAAGFQVLLAQAAGGISLEDVILAATSFDGVGDAIPELELREDGTELWFTTGADLPPPTGPALDLQVIGQEGATITYGVSIDPALVTDGVLDELLFTLNFDDALISYVADSISGDFSAMPGSLVISGSDLNISNLDDPILTFDMRLAPAADAGAISFGMSDVSVNGVAMEDQTGEDGFDLAYDAAFFTLGGVVDIRDLRADPTTPDGTVVIFTESGSGATHEATLDAGGSFSFLLEQGTEGSLEILRDYDIAVDKTIDIDDVYELLYLFVNYAEDGSSPWLTTPPAGWIAADFTDNGEVGIDDVYALLYHFIDYDPPGEPTFDPRWVFIDQDESWDDLGIDNVPQPGAFDIGPMAADIDMSFLGILTGDLQGQV
ncbi:MAG: hypothetical protein JJT99_09950 [Rhodobacteraceae bacterium]|nr:hypothetical protein [Paracoccaceae bacterium]